MSKFNVFVRDSVPEARINSSILNGLPAEYSADSNRAVDSFSSYIFTNIKNHRKLT